MGSVIHGVFQALNAHGCWEDIVTDYGYQTHHLLFSWLADVHNNNTYYIEPLSKPRGLPVDFIVDSENWHPVMANAFRGGDQAQSYSCFDDDPNDPLCLRLWMGSDRWSWLDADEILKATIPSVKVFGILAIDDYREWDRVSPPKGASPSDNILGRRHLVAIPDEIGPDTTHVSVFWDSPADGEFDLFLDEVRRLRVLHKEVRFVFGFDT